MTPTLSPIAQKCIATWTQEAEFHWAKMHEADRGPNSKRQHKAAYDRYMNAVKVLKMRAAG